MSSAAFFARSRSPATGTSRVTGCAWRVMVGLSPRATGASSRGRCLLASEAPIRFIVSLGLVWAKVWVRSGKTATKVVRPLRLSTTHFTLSLSQLFHIPQSRGARSARSCAPARVDARRSRAVRACGLEGRKGEAGGAACSPSPPAWGVEGRGEEGGRSISAAMDSSMPGRLPITSLFQKRITRQPCACSNRPNIELQLGCLGSQCRALPSGGVHIAPHGEESTGVGAHARIPVRPDRRPSIVCGPTSRAGTLGERLVANCGRCR